MSTDGELEKEVSMIRVGGMSLENIEEFCRQARAIGAYGPEIIKGTMQLSGKVRSLKFKALHTRPVGWTPEGTTGMSVPIQRESGDVGTP